MCWDRTKAWHWLFSKLCTKEGRQRYPAVHSANACWPEWVKLHHLCGPVLLSRRCGSLTGLCVPRLGWWKPCLYHPCPQNTLFSFDLLIWILSWISPPVWGSRKQMTRNSGEAPEKVLQHCLRSRDPSCVLPSSQQSLWIAHLLEEMGSALSQGSSHTVLTPLRGTDLPCWCCHLSISSFCVWLSSEYSMSILLV